MDRLGRHDRPTLASVALVTTVLVGACGSETTSSPPAVPEPTVAASAPRSAATQASPAAPSVVLIPQPEIGDLEVAPDSARVDLAMPTFSDPTTITNPLFPVSSQESVVLLGRVDDLPFRTEVTLLPEPRVIQWEGQTVPTLVSQYVAYLDGRIHEVAYDLYAQADDGSVWYFGEDVFNFGDGAIVDTHGTWIAGVDGPAAMIMPADPSVGDVYRPENIPGFVFEEVTVKAVDQTLDGPLGPVPGGLIIEELHMDGATEEKSFGPGYGEFYTEGDGDVEAMGLVVPTDALTGPPPADLTTISTEAQALLEAARSKDWQAASTALDSATPAWAAYRTTGVPDRVTERIDAALAALASAIDARRSTRAQQAAIDLRRSALDLELRHRPPVAVDVDRFSLWLEQLKLDAAAGDGAAVNGDFFSLDYVRDRIAASLAAADVAAMNVLLEETLNAIGDEDLDQASAIADRLLAQFAGVTPRT